MKKIFFCLLCSAQAVAMAPEPVKYQWQPVITTIALKIVDAFGKEKNEGVEKGTVNYSEMESSPCISRRKKGVPTAPSQFLTVPKKDEDITQ